MTTRRSFIKVLAALPPALSFRRSWATSGAAPDPSRLALIIGNSAYREAPLTNPANDARAIGGLFAQAGFTVDSHLDATRVDMMAAIERFGNAARRADTKLVVFYYAGHGAQLDWRNYLLPVDAVVEKQEHMKQRCIDLGLLLGQLNAARDKTFVIILDACRNNPFGTAYRPEQKGLSQFDAPVGSLLAYATAPGNVASDGEGQNGLYTEHLVRELGQRGTRIEDALKRVRLNVRLASNGAQIPWETTSLEGDVYIFDSGAAKLSETEIERQLEADIAEWTRIKSSKNIDDWIGYLRNFPNGRFAEIAQMRVNRLLAEAEQLAAEKRRAEEQKAREEQQRLEQQRIERERIRIAEEQRMADERRKLAEQQARELQRRQTEQKNLEDKRRMEQEVLAREQQERAAAEQLAAERQRLEDAQRRLQQERLAQPAAGLAAAATSPAAQAATSTDRQPIEIREGLPVPQLMAPSANPYSAGRYPLNRIFTVGDEATIRLSDILTGLVERTDTARVTKVDYEADRVEYNHGFTITDLMGNAIKLGPAEYDTPVQFFPAEFQIGKKWTAAFRLTRDGNTTSAYYDVEIVKRETVTVPAGTFDTFRIEGNGWNNTIGSKLEYKAWVVPGLNFSVKSELMISNRGRFFRTERRELVALRQQMMDIR
ncbi:MAG: caspase family protein [Sulfuritalea sp.]|nr:caspase family protein [Sulfuritalea sp.]